MKKTIVVEQDENAPVERKVLAQAIVDISAAAKRLAKSGLNKKGIVILLKASSGQPQWVCERVLESLEALAKDYTG